MHYIKPLCLAILWAMLCFPASMYAQATRSVHTVKPGETLYAISKMYGVSVDEIRQANPGLQEAINSGMQLYIPTAGNACVFHTIQPKETLYSIARKYRVEKDSIVRANPGLSETNFKYGTTIKIPVSRMAATAVDTTTVASAPAGIAGTNCREMYVSAKGETLYGIAAKYNVEVVDLMAANPDIKKDAGKKLRKGTYVCIPFAKTVAAAEATKPLANASERVIPLKKSYKVVLLMPFYSDGGRSADFYRGLLYGMNTLRKNGTDFAVEAYNAGQSVVDINKILSNESVKSADIVISSASEAVSNIVADYCKQHKIKMFLPFSVAFDAVFSNPYVVLANMPQSYEYAACLKFFFSSLPSTANVVLFEGSRQTDLYRKVVYELDARHIPYVKVGASASPAEFAKALRNDVRNIVFPSSSLKSDYGTLYKLISNSGTEGRDVRVFGYDNWKDFDTPTRETFYDVDVTLCVPQFINVYSPEYSPSRQFYIETFGTVPTTNMQRSYYLGIDCAAELFADGNASLSKPFKFARVNTWGGAMNKAMRIVSYTKKHTTVISDYE